MSSARAFDAVLFDLDGTLIDTAPDMAGALNDMLVSRGQPEVPFAELRPRVSHGSRALVERGFGSDDEDLTRARIAEFLAVYAQRVARETQLFAGMERLLVALEERDIAWGIVTNKPGDLSESLLKAIDLWPRLAAHVAGDTLAERKPHPLPLLHAARHIDVAPERCLYVGDAERDIEAGRAARMTTLAVRYGYILPDDCATRWGANHVVDTVDALGRKVLDLIETGSPPHAYH
ncbi:MAG: phosphoglycolate phosphatase [Pseudomonadota bacterium]